MKYHVLVFIFLFSLIHPIHATKTVLQQLSSAIHAADEDTVSRLYKELPISPEQQAELVQEAKDRAILLLRAINYHQMHTKRISSCTCPNLKRNHKLRKRQLEALIRIQHMLEGHKEATIPFFYHYRATTNNTLLPSFLGLDI